MCSFSTCWRSFYWNAAFIRGRLTCKVFCVCKSRKSGLAHVQRMYNSTLRMLQSCSKCMLMKLNEHLGMRKAAGFSRTSMTLGSQFSSCSFLVRLIGAASILCEFYSNAAFAHDITVSKGIDMVHRWSIRLGEPIRLELLYMQILFENVPSLQNVHKNSFPIFKHQFSTPQMLSRTCSLFLDSHVIIQRSSPSKPAHFFSRTKSVLSLVLRERKLWYVEKCFS